MEKEKIQKKNELIRRAILVSQMQDHEGFKIFMEDLSETVKAIQFQDIRGIKTEKELDTAKGYVAGIEDLKYYFSGQKNFALQKMVDEETGEEEVLNKKEEE